MDKQGRLVIYCPSVAHEAVRNVVEASEINDVLEIVLEQDWNYIFAQAKVDWYSDSDESGTRVQWEAFYYTLRHTKLIPIITALDPGLAKMDKDAGLWDAFSPAPRRGGEAQPQTRSRRGR